MILSRRNAARRSSIVRAVYAVEQLETRCLLTSITSAAFDVTVVPNTLTLAFDRDVHQEFNANSFILENATLDQGKSVPTIAFSTGGTVATITYPSDADSLSELPGTYADGFYRLAIGVDDVAGLAAPFVYDFPVLTGDVTHDGVVDGADYFIVDAGFIRGYTGWDNGDFDYSGQVDSSDYNLMDFSYAVALQAPPTAPSEILVTYVPSSQQFAVNWNADSVSGEAGWRVQRSLDGQNFSQWYQNIPGDLTGSAAFTDSDPTLPDGSRVYYRVRAYGNSQDTAYTPKASGVTRLGSPSNVSATISGTHQITLTWTDTSSHETGFEVYQRVDDLFTQVASVGANVNSVTVSGLPEGADYDFRIRAVNAITTSGRGALVSVSLPIASPTQVFVDASSLGGNTISWTDHSDVETGFVVERKTGSGSFSEIGSTAANVTSFADVTSTLDTDYTYRVRAKSGALLSDPSSGVTIHTPVRLYSNDFENGGAGSFAPGVTGGWGDDANKISARGNKAVLGGFAGEGTELNLAGIGAHQFVTVDLHLIFWGSWLGNGVNQQAPGVDLGDDRWTLTANDQLLTSTTIATNANFDQSWPSPNVAADNPAGTAEETTDQGLAIPGDDGTYHMSFRFQDSAAFLKFLVASSLHVEGGGIFGISGIDVYGGETSAGSFANEPSLGTPLALDSHTVRVNYTLGHVESGFPFIYPIKRSTDQLNWTLVLNPSIFSSYIIDYQADPGTPYFYRFTKNGSLTGLTAQVTTPASALRVAPYLTTLSAVSSNRIDLRWQPYSAVDLQGFNIYRFSGGPTGPTEYPLDDAHRIASAVQGLTFSDVGLAGGTTYHYFVAAAFPVGESAADGATKATPGTALPAPTNLVATGVTTTTASLEWGSVAGAATYSLYRGTTEDFEPSTASRIAGPSASRFFDDTLLTPGARYYYKATAANAANGQSGESNTVAIVTTDVPPITPAGVSVVEVTTGRIRVEWSPIANAAEYALQLSIDGGAWQTAFSGRRGTSATFDHLNSGTLYGMRIRASNGVGASDWSVSVTQRTLLETPGRPRAFSATLHTGGNELHWQPPTVAANVTGYRVAASIDDDDHFVTIAELAATRTSYVDWHFLAGAHYFYRVSALNGTLASEPAQLTLTAMRPLPNAPTLPQATIIHSETFAGPQTHLDLTWTDNSLIEDGFRVSAMWTYKEALQDVNAQTEHVTAAFGKHAGTGPVTYTLDVPAAVQRAWVWTLQWSVVAFNESGDSSPLLRPNAPTDVHLVQNPLNGSWNISWKETSDPPAAEFWIFRDGDVIDIIPGTSKSYDDVPVEGGASDYMIGAHNAAGGEKSEPESTDLPTLSISVPDDQASEPGHKLNDKGKFRITSLYGDKGASAKLSVKGSAKEGDDYDALPKSVNVGGGTNVDVDLVAKSDDVREPDETVTYVLETSPFYHGSGSVSATIMDTDYADIRVDSDNSGEIQEADDSIEEDGDKPGKVVVVNDDDDNGNGVPDYNDVGADPDLVPVTLSSGVGTDSPPATIVSLKTVSGGAHFKLWGSAQRSGQPLLDPSDGEASWNLASMPSTLWFEAIDPSANAADITLRLERHSDGDASAPGEASDIVKLTALRVQFLKTYSDQFADVDANHMIKPGDPNNLNGRSNNPYILMGARSNNAGYARADVSISPDVPVMRELLRFRFATIGDEQSLWRSAGAVLQNNMLRISVRPPPPEEPNADPERDTAVEATITWGIDFNRNWKESANEVLGVNRNHIWWTDRESYEGAIGYMTALQHEWSAAFMEHSANFMYAFLNDRPTSDATSQIVTLRPNAFGTDHNVGATFGANLEATIRRNSFSPGSAIAAEIANSEAIRQRIQALIIENQAAILAYLGTPESPALVTPYNFDATDAEKSLDFANGLNDLDLFTGIGKLTINQPGLPETPMTTPLRVRAKLEYSATRDLHIFDINISMVGYDLYDFNFASPSLNPITRNVRMAATVEAGYGTLGTAGRVFENVFEIDNARDEMWFSDG